MPESELVTEEEVRQLAYAMARAPKPFFYAELTQAIKWAMQVRVDSATLDLVLTGKAALSVDENGEIVFYGVEEDGH